MTRFLRVSGQVIAVQGSTITAQLPQAAVGDLCWLVDRSHRAIPGQVISFNNDLFSLSLFEKPDGIYPGATIFTRGETLSVPVGSGLLGRVVNPLGVPIDGKPLKLTQLQHRPVVAQPPSASLRPLISEKLETGIRSIDGFCTLGLGQRIGIFAPAGVGKSTLLGMVARNASVDVTVVALVGERGREVREFLDETLGSSGLCRSVVVVATSDDSSLLRQTAPYTATTIAEHFRDAGKNVLLIVDSLTRTARALRETSLAAGDLPVRHGYTNSVYTELPRLLERAGRSESGSITALYTVLTNQEDDIDPLADEVKSLLDGHICLRHEMAALGVLPAVDITQSISRLFPRLTETQHQGYVRTIRRAMNRFIKERQIVLMGGTPDAELERIIALQPLLIECLRQETGHTSSFNSTESLIRELALALTS